MNDMNWLVIYPEVWLLVLACAVALVDLFVEDPQRGPTYWLSQAGIAVFADARDTSLEDWNRQIDVNLRGVIHGIAAAYPLMVRRGRGHIVNTASAAGLLPIPTNLLAAIIWLASVIPWALRFAPIYLRPRVDGRPG